MTDILNSISLDNMSNEKLNSIFNHIKNLAIDNSSEILDKIDNKLIKKENFFYIK